MKTIQAKSVSATAQRWRRLVMLQASLFVLISFLSPQAQADTLALPKALELTLLHNPQLQTFPFDQRMAEAQKLQQGLRPNPELALSVENVLGTGDSSAFSGAETTLQLSQLIELGDKRQRRIDLADAQKHQQTANYELQRIEALAETSRRFYQLLKQQALLDWSKRRIAIEQQALSKIETRARAGAVLQADVAGMALRLAESKAEQQQLIGEQTLAQRRLAAMWSAEPNFELGQGDLNAMPAAPTAATVLDAAATAPQYLRLQSLERIAAANHQLQQANSQFDLTLGGGLRRDEASNDTSIVFNVSVPLQLTNPNQGNLLAARIERDKLLEQQKLARQELRLTLLTIHQSMSNSLMQVHHLDNQLLPLASQWLEKVELAYRTGQLGVRSLLDVQSKQFELERQRIEMQTNVWLQLLQLERLTGHAFQSNHTLLSPSLEIQ